jgi:hypothetical protein
VLQAGAKSCHPDLMRDEIVRFTSHSGRLWAIVLLDKAGMLPDFIKLRLRWMGDARHCNPSAKAYFFHMPAINVKRYLNKLPQFI